MDTAIPRNLSFAMDNGYDQSQKTMNTDPKPTAYPYKLRKTIIDLTTIWSGEIDYALNKKTISAITDLPLFCSAYIGF
jgi:hypothetical protein